MSPEFAQLVVVGITLLGAIVWLFSLVYLVKSARLTKSAENALVEEPSRQDMLTGGAECSGDAQVFRGTAAEFFAKGTLGPLKIVEEGDDRLVFERLVPGVGRQPPGRWFRRGEMRFTRLGQNRTHVEWLVEPGRFHWLLTVGAIMQLVGLVALTVGCWAMLRFVAISQDETVRWQSLQMLQVSHLLWPPFLFAGLYRWGIRGLQAEFQAIASNLPHLSK